MFHSIDYRVAAPVPTTAVALSSVNVLMNEIGSAGEVELAAYTLENRALETALTGAVRDGAHVRVILARAPAEDPHGTIAARNAAVVQSLRAAGVDAVLSGPDAPSPHLKAAILDGVAYLDDANFRSGGADTVIRDRDPNDVAAVRSTIDGRPQNGPGLLLRKADALAAEAGAIARGSREVDVETEAFGSGSLVAEALAARAGANAQVKLLVSAAELREPAADRERALLAKLAAKGVEIRVSAEATEKLAFTGEAAWIGSANATYAGSPDSGDWGLVTTDDRLVDALHARFLGNWAVARPYAPGSVSGAPPARAKSSRVALVAEATTSS